MTAGLQTCLGHTFADAAVSDEVRLQSANLFVEEEIGLMEQADCDVGDDFRRAGFDEVAVNFERDVRSGAELTDEAGFLGVFAPELEVAYAQKVLIIDQQFFEAGTCDVG